MLFPLVAKHSDESPLLLRDRAFLDVSLAQHFTFPETSMLAAHTCHVALGTHHPSQQLMPDLYCQGKAGAASGTCVWKALSWTVSDKLGELCVMLPIAEVTEVGSVTRDQAT